MDLQIFLMNYKGYSNITYSENVNPQLAFFKGAIDTSRVAAFSYRVNGANSGHTVAVEGYMDARVKGTLWSQMNGRKKLDILI